MKRLLLTNLAIVSFAQVCNAKADPGPKDYRQVKVAIIDTGLSSELYSNPEYCKTGHRDFTIKEPQIPLSPTMKQLEAYIKKMEEIEHPKDDHGHGTHISSIVDQYAKDFVFRQKLKEDIAPKEIDKIKVNYCQIILKYYSNTAPEIENMVNTVKAIKWAIKENVDIINYSGGGIAPFAAERAAIQEALDKGIIVVAAAGNERSDIDAHPYYPAMYDKRIYIVGNEVNSFIHTRDPSSNYGKSVNVWEKGRDVFSRLPNGQYGYMTGTSQAAAIKSGKLVRQMLNAR